MTNDKPALVSGTSFADRKKALIAQGAARRRDVKESVHIVRDNLHANKLAKNAVGHLTGAAYSAMEKVFHTNNLRSASLRKMIPLAASVYSIVSKRKMIVPILRGAAIVGSVSAGAVGIWRYKKKTREADAQTRAEAAALGYPNYIDPGV
ncbi:MAG: hypothetical protein NVSMB6_06900 [Burkholderiaceae bacterium]